MPQSSARDRLERFRRSDWIAYVKKNARVFWFFFRYLRPYKSKVILGLISKFVQTPFYFAGAFLQRYLIDEVVLNSMRPEEERIGAFFLILGLQVLMWAIGHLKGIVYYVIAWYVDIRVTIDIMRDFYNHEHSLDLAWHRTRAIGEHMYRTAEDITDGDIGWQRGGLVGMITYDWMEIFDIFYNVFWAAMVFGIIDKTLGLMALGYLVPWSIVQHKLQGWYKKIDYENREIEQERFAVNRDVMAGLKTYKSLGRTRFVSNRFVQIMTYAQRIYYKIQASRWIGGQGVNWLVRNVTYNNGIKIYSFAMVMLGRYSIGDITVVMATLGQVLRPFEQLIHLIQRFRMRLVPAERMVETFDVKPKIVEKRDGYRFSQVRGNIQLRNVTFGYSPDRVLLRNVDLSIESGQRVAFVGPSGAGKSTIFNLMLRLYDPFEGSVLVDGQDLKDARLKSYLDRVGVILQETFLFSGTIRDNIRYGNLLARPAEVDRAVKLASLEDYVKESPDGLDTWLGEGTKISGGQKQRVGIARAIIRNPGMWIMDEPTAHLDVIAETNVMKTIEEVTRGKTTLVISHRISPILFVDRLVVVTPQGIEAVGTHKELLEKSPTYQRLWEEQQEEGRQP